MTVTYTPLSELKADDYTEALLLVKFSSGARVPIYCTYLYGRWVNTVTDQPIDGDPVYVINLPEYPE